MKDYYLILLIINFFSVFPTKAQSDTDKMKVEKIDSFIHMALEKCGVVPGLGVAVVVDDKLLFANGFGHRDVENTLPVTANTGFYLASVTKSFLAMAAAQMEYQQLISLDSSLGSFYPDHQFKAPIDSKDITLVDLLSHNHPVENSGLQYRLAFIDSMSNEEFARVLFEHSSPRESGFAYSNLGYNIVGDILEITSGKSWKKVVLDEVLRPIGMHHSTPYMYRASDTEYAYPYVWEGGKFRRLAIKTENQMHAAGGLISTPMDLAKWLIVQMNGGKLQTSQVIPEAVMRRIHQKYATLDREYYEYNRSGYELGWYQADYEGVRMVHHFGGFSGYMSHVSYLPGHRIGVVSLANEADHGGLLPHLVANYIYDVMLGKENLDSKYQAALNSLQQNVLERKARTEASLAEKRDMLARASTKFSTGAFNIPDLSGTYYNPRLGPLEIEMRKDGTLWSTFGVHSVQMLAIDKDHFLVDWQLRGYLSPPIELTVTYDDSSKKVKSLNWGHRTFLRQ